ncbi:unnamed protein product [Dictyota dichotoma]
MSHYTAIKTKYKNFFLLKKSINKLGFPYTENVDNIEVGFISSKSLSFSIYEENSINYLSFQLSGINYNIISDYESWSRKDIFRKFLQKLEVNYSYSEIVNQALELGFTRTKKVFDLKQNNKFVFQRCVEILN